MNKKGWDDESIKTEKTTTKIISTKPCRREDLETLLSEEEQNRFLQTILFILLIITFINTYLW